MFMTISYLVKNDFSQYWLTPIRDEIESQNKASLRLAKMRDPALRKENFTKIFSNIDIIFHIHKEFVKELKVGNQLTVATTFKKRVNGSGSGRR